MFFQVKANGRGEIFLFPFPSALDDNDFHVSLHSGSYGMHFKINRPYRIQSEPLKYEEFIEMIKDAQSRVLKQIIRLPRKGHDYCWIIPKIQDSAIEVKENPKRTEIKIKGPLLTDFETIWKSETHLIPRDFISLRNCYDPSLLTGFVPDTKEVFYFIPLSTEQIDSLADIVDEFDYNVYSKIKGVFITISQDNGYDLLKESLPRLFEIVSSFFGEVEEEGLNLFDIRKLSRMFNLPAAFP